MGNLPPRGVEPKSFHTVNTGSKHESAIVQGQDSVKVLDVPKDLQYLLRKWDSLPKGVKKTILSLVKHSAEVRKKAKMR
jgi:hypothetical protein